MSAVDIFTKYCWLFPLRKTTSISIIKSLENGIFLPYGTPATIILDNAQYFKSKVFKEFVEKYKIPKLFYNCVYSPQSNSVERYNQSIETSLAIMVGDNQRTWDKHLPLVQHALNNTTNMTTSFTPSYLFFGRELIVDGRFHKPFGYIPKDGEPVQISDAWEHARGLEKLSETYDIVQQKILESFQTNAQRYNLRRKRIEYDVGDVVWVRQNVLSKKAEFFSNKLAPRFMKLRVAEKKSAVAYELEDLKGKKKGLFHVKDMVKEVDGGEGGKSNPG